MAAAPWLVSRRFDLTWFFGGAVLSLLFLIVWAGGLPIVALWWVWLLAFDGPHIGAAFTRTYFDADEWRRRPGLLIVSLLTFAIGPLALAANAVTRSDDPFLLFLAFATFYGYYHVVRQHYGFVALYNAINRDYDKKSVALDKRTLYIGCWAPYAYFLITHPKARELMRLAPMRRMSIESFVALAILAVWVATIVFYVAAHTRDFFRNPKTAYLTGTVLLYGAIYYAVARLEPVYAASQGPDQDFLLLSILIVTFHNVQYLGLVWFHNRNRYAEPAGHGFATFVNRAPLTYLGACALFSIAIYFTFACSTGVFPLCQWFPGNRIGLCLWWGLAMNHYYLDQKIWRIRGDDELKRSLRLA